MIEDKEIKEEKLDKVSGGLWTINGVRCDKYIIRTNGETLAHIAEILETTQSILMSLNTIKDPCNIPIGTDIFYPIK